MKPELEQLNIITEDQLFRAEIKEEQEWDDAYLNQLQAEEEAKYPLDRPDCNPAGEPWTDPVGGTHDYEPGQFGYDPAKMYE